MAHPLLPETRVNPLIKRRDMMVQVLLFIVTIGIYGFYWFYQTTLEMKNFEKNDEVSPGLWTVLLFIPLVNFYVHYKYSELFEDFANENVDKWILFILWIVFCPAVWFIVQTELNKRADLMAAPV